LGLVNQMKLTDIFRCPQCQQTLDDKQVAQFSFLYCQRCTLLTPIIDGFALFTQSCQESELSTTEVTKIAAILSEKFNNSPRYQHYMENKLQRGVLEIYAAFHPFNEANRAIYPFIDSLHNTLKEGDIILDTWARTGWTSLFLASLFPQQQVISFWEGDNSVLGYSGFGYWFNEAKRPKNLRIAFLAPEQNLPVADGCIKVIHGHDIVHRRPMKHYIQDLLRVSSEDGLIMLPHVHLSNDQPDPYFERGGEIRHGQAYRELYNSVINEKCTTAMVLSEAQLFSAQRPLELNDAANGTDYNAMLIIAPNGLFQQKLSENWLQKHPHRMRLIVNPLLKICFFTGRVSLNTLGEPDQVSYLLARHPIYHHRLINTLTKTISGLQRDILMMVPLGLTLEELSKHLNSEISVLIQACNDLASSEIVALLPVAKCALDLQNFHCNHYQIINPSFAGSLADVASSAPGFTMIFIDNEAVTTQELLFLVDGWRRYLRLKENTDVLQIKDFHSIVIPLIMACWLENIYVQTSDDIANNELLLLSNKEKNTFNINLIGNNSTSYWNILEQFLSTDPLPPVTGQNKVATVDQTPWYIWLSEHLNII